MERAHTEFSLGAIYINAPGKSVQIVNVEPVTSPNVEYLGAFAVWPSDLLKSVGVDAGPGFPVKEQTQHHPTSDLIPATETALRSSAGHVLPLTVTAGFRIKDGDVAAVNGVRVTYRADGELRHEFASAAVIACVKPNKCGEDRADIHQFWDEVLQGFGLEPKT